MNKTKVAHLVDVRYQFGRYFCQPFEKLLAKVPEGRIKKVLQQNMDGEMGEKLIMSGTSA